MMLRWVLFALFLGISVSAGKVGINVLARGWGDTINWVESYEQGLAMMKESKKPLMVIIHKEDSKESQETKKAFVSNEAIQELANEDFIMVNLLEDDTTSKTLAPDGLYVPRILFFDSSGAVRKDIAGKYSLKDYTYDTYDMIHLLENMKIAKTPLHAEL